MNYAEQDQAYLYHQEIIEIHNFFGQFQDIDLAFETVSKVIIPQGMTFPELRLKKIEKIISHKIMARKIVFIVSQILKNKPFLKEDKKFPACLLP